MFFHEWCRAENAAFLLLPYSDHSGLFSPVSTDNSGIRSPAGDTRKEVSHSPESIARIAGYAMLFH